MKFNTINQNDILNDQHLLLQVPEEKFVKNYYI